MSMTIHSYRAEKRIEKLIEAIDLYEAMLKKPENESQKERLTKKLQAAKDGLVEVIRNLI